MEITDDLRIINYSDTQTRRLEVISAIVKTIGKKQIPLELIKKQVIKWSSSLENHFPQYKLKKGRVTDGGKPTRAFDKYILLMKEMKIIHQLGGMVSLTILGSILLKLVEHKSTLSYNLSMGEKTFYLHNLMTLDADFFFLPLDILNKSSSNLIQKEFQTVFKEAILSRLEIKYRNCNKKAGLKIGEKKLTIANDWKNAYSYSEHLIAPRLEWLTDLGILDRKERFYLLSGNGKIFQESLIKISSDENFILEVNDKWINTSLFSSINVLFPNSFMMFKELEIEQQNRLMGYVLEKSSNLFRSGNALKIALAPTYLFTSIYSFSTENIVIEFEDISCFLKEDFTFNRRLYRIKRAARINEGYITIKLKD